MVEQNIDWTAAWKELESGGAEKQHLAVGTQKTMSDFYKWWSRLVTTSSHRNIAADPSKIS